MGTNGRKVFLNPQDIPDYLIKYKEQQLLKGYTEYQINAHAVIHFTDTIIPKYTRDWQDNNLKEWIDMILYEPEGYSKAQSLLEKTTTFEHYKHVNTTSYAKGNVGDQRAKRELTPKGYETYISFKKFNEKNKKKENKSIYS